MQSIGLVIHEIFEAEWVPGVVTTPRNVVISPRMTETLLVGERLEYMSVNKVSTGRLGLETRMDINFLHGNLYLAPSGFCRPRTAPLVCS